MNGRLPIGIAAGAILCACVAVAPTASTNATGVARLRLELADGTCVAILPSHPVLRFRTSYGDIPIPWGTLKSGVAKAERWDLLLQNGDRLLGLPIEPVIKGEGPLGAIGVPGAAVRAIQGTAAVERTDAKESPASAIPPGGKMVLKDGSSIRVTLQTDRLVLRSEHLGRIEIPADRIRSVDASTKPHRVGIDTGDVLAGALETDTIEVTSDLGALRVSMAKVSRMSLSTVAGCAGLPEGLVAYYPLDGPGPRVRDASGNGNDGETHGARFFEDGGVGGCFEFRGGPDEGDFIRVPHSASLVSMQETRELTLCAWIRARSIPKDFPVVLGKGGNQKPDCCGGYEFTLNGHGDNDLSFTSGTSAALITRNARGRYVNRRLDRWIHIVVVLQSRPTSSEFAFYVDGVRSEIGEADSGLDGRNAQFDIQNDLYIGGPDPRHHRNRAFFDGWIDEVMIFNRRLAAEEIRAIYDAGAGHVRGDKPDGEAVDGPDPAAGSDPRPAVPQRRTSDLRQAL